MRLNLHLLRIFFTVADLRSFSRAAEALFVSQPAVSKAGMRSIVRPPYCERTRAKAEPVSGVTQAGAIGQA